MYIGNLMLLILNLPLVGVFVTVLRLPQHILATLVLLLCLVGAFSLSNSFLDLWVLVIFGVFGYALRKLRVDPSPMVVALVLGPMMEKTLRQALFLTRGKCRDLVAPTAAGDILILAAAPFSGRRSYAHSVNAPRAQDQLTRGQPRDGVPVDLGPDASRYAPTRR